MNKEPSDAYSPDEAELWEALARYLVGESAPAESARIRQWLAGGPGRAELIAALDRSLQRLPARAGADVDVDAALQRVKTHIAEPKVYEFRASKSIPAEQSSRGWSRTLVRMAATVIVVLGVSLVWRASRDPVTSLVATSFTTAVGQTDSLRLSDGTRVVLGPLSHLRLTENYGSGARAVELDGEALFDVRHNASRPFSVRAGGATIRDIGTTFSVRSVEGDGVRVAVTLGSVVLHATNSPESEGAVLRAGDRGTLDATGKVVAERGSVTADDIAFTAGRLVFDEAPLDHVAAELRRWYGIELRLDDEALAGRHLTAVFNQDSAEEVLNVIALAFGASIERKGDTAFVRIPR